MFLRKQPCLQERCGKHPWLQANFTRSRISILYFNVLDRPKVRILKHNYQPEREPMEQNANISNSHHELISGQID